MIRKRATAGLAVILSLTVATLGGSSTAVAQAASVKATYDVAGPHVVVEEHVVDEFGGESILFRPSELDQGPFPVIVWGNGSGEGPETYQGLLTHFASWGFMVIGTTFQEVGTGEEMTASLDHLEVMAADPANPIFGAVDLDWVGVTGHSQGAGGSAMMATRDGRLDAVATVALPSEPFAFEPEKQYDVDAIELPILFFGGSLDPLSPNTTNMDYFGRVQGPAAVGMLTGASHNDVQGDGAAFRPYLTAWFRYLLADDPMAALAFTGDAPELAGDLDFNSVDFRDLPTAGERAPATTPPPAPKPGPAQEPTPTPAPAPRPAPAPPPVSSGSPVVPAAPAPDLRAPEVAPAPPGELPRPAGPSADLALPAAIEEEVGDVIDLPALLIVLLVVGAAIHGLVPRRTRAVAA